MRFRLNLIFVFFCFGLFAGCATPPDVKQASSNVSAAIDELDHAIVNFQNLYVAEVEKTRQELAKAYVARAVSLKIQSLAIDAGKPPPGVSHHGLIGLSREIEGGEDSARRVVAAIIRLKPKTDADAAKALKERNSDIAQALRRQAKEFRKHEYSKETAEEFELKADDLERVATRTQDKMMDDMLESIVSLAQMKRDIPSDLSDLRSTIQFLGMTHDAVHAWIMADVTVSGEDVGEMLIKHEKTLWPSPPSPESNGGGSS